MKGVHSLSHPNINYKQTFKCHGPQIHPECCAGALASDLMLLDSDCVLSL